MRSHGKILVLVGLFGTALAAHSPPAAAQNQSRDDSNNNNNNSSNNSGGNVSTASEKGTGEGMSVGINHFAVRPNAGAIIFNGNQRFTGGVMLDFNALNTPWAKIGPSVGALFSSTDTGNFFSGVSTGNSNNIIQIPANLKATLNPLSSDRLDVGVHGGVNIVRSNGGQLATTGPFGGAGSSFGGNLGSTAGASWDAHPNVGADLDYSLSKNVGVSFRPDLTMMPNFNMETLTLGLALQL